MQNANVVVSGSTLTITVDLTQNVGPSKSGKTDLIAKGAEKLPNGLGLTLCVYKKH